MTEVIHEAGPVIPDEAVEASMTAAVEYLSEWSPNLAAGLDGFDQVFKVALEAALPHMQANTEWGIFRAKDNESGTPIENRLYRSREAAQKYIDTGYTQPEYWEVRGRPVGVWAK